MSEAIASNSFSNIGLIKVFVRRANTRFAPTLVSDIGWISITTIYPKTYDRLLMIMKNEHVIFRAFLRLWHNYHPYIFWKNYLMSPETNFNPKRISRKAMSASFMPLNAFNPITASARSILPSPLISGFMVLFPINITTCATLDVR